MFEDLQLPNYILRNGTPILSHYTASIPIKVFNEYGRLQTIQRIDYVLGTDDLQEFKDNITLFSTAALLLFGASEKLSPGIIEMLNGNQVSGGFRYLIEEWTNPGNIITALNMFVIGLPRTGLSGNKAKRMIFTTAEGTTTDLQPTLNRIASGRTYPHKNDGSVFKNFAPTGRTTPLLPVKPFGYYREFVHPTPGTSGPGSMRIVTGQGGEIWFTSDHYKSFIQVK